MTPWQVARQSPSLPGRAAGGPDGHQWQVAPARASREASAQDTASDGERVRGLFSGAGSYKVSPATPGMDQEQGAALGLIAPSRRSEK